MTMDRSAAARWVVDLRPLGHKRVLACWICGGDPSTCEHKTKRSDLRAVFGTPTQSTPLYFHGDERRNRRVGSLDARILKSTSRICAHCNNARTHTPPAQLIADIAHPRSDAIRRGLFGPHDCAVTDHLCRVAPRARQQAHQHPAMQTASFVSLFVSPGTRGGASSTLRASFSAPSAARARSSAAS